ncbi:MAG TPA: DUF2382 domain-containing protein [Methylibium sp.]|uniref:DUF2382 domain-containing protein n=1 Tax=Methylibium sp. TaxID=2067992 RepID=UPI002DB93A36|nr:DUF2382 domain-containing protein [Methylibium sp.]HEU4457662.1 DUF2382 domain-containing protein [Methylibium sp.]
MSPSSPPPPPAAAQPAAGDEPSTIGVLEEEARIGRERVVTGVLHIHKTVHDETEALHETGFQEYAEVRRVPIGRVVDAASPPRTERGVTIVPVYEERVRIVRELVLAEELHVSLRRVPFDRTLQLSRRRERVSVEHRDVAPDGSTTRD